MSINVYANALLESFYFLSFFLCYYILFNASWMPKKEKQKKKLLLHFSHKSLTEWQSTKKETKWRKDDGSRATHKKENLENIQAMKKEMIENFMENSTHIHTEIVEILW